MRVALRFVVILGVLASSTPALAQFEATKFPVDGVVFDPLMGQYVADPGATIRWRVVLHNLVPPPFGQDLNVDFNDVLGGDSCSALGGPPLPCSSEALLDLLCPADQMDPDYPTVDGVPVDPADCDDGTNTISISRIPVNQGAAVCIEFSSVLSLMASGFVGNAGCVNVVEAGQIGPTSPANTAMGTWPWDCVANRPTAEMMPNCTLLFALELPDFEFDMLKTASHDDADGNGLVDVGEEITWTVTMTDTSTDMMDVTGYFFDTIEPDQDFVRIDMDVPGGNCAYDMLRGDVMCDPLLFTDGEVKTLVFTTVVNCNALTESDDNQICNQARMCSDDTGFNCAPSDDDGMFSGIPDPTCLDFNQVAFDTSEKTYTWVDNDGDGALTNGDTVTWTITVNNSGSRDATNVVVDDDVSANVDPVAGCFDEASISVADGGAYDPILGLVSWTIPSIAAGGSATVSFDVNVTENPPCCNQASINSDERTVPCPMAPGTLTDDPSQGGDADPSCLIFGPQPLVVVEKDFTESMPDGQVMVGEDITWTVTVRNDGAGPATNVSINDPVFGCFSNCTLPPTIIGEGTDNSSGPGMGTACTIQVDDIGGMDGLTMGEEVTIEWTVTVDATNCCNRAVATFAEPPGSVESVDPVTGGTPTCVDRAETDCTNMVDDDGDGLTDCADADCAMDPACMGVENCANGVDDDGDGNIDCESGNEDADCPCGPESIADMNCMDGVDNDGDGLTDALDPDCILAEDCTNGLDDDGDGNIDCETGNEDADCPCGPESLGDMNCADGVDNDGDGLTDSADPDCAGAEDCSNGTDDDGDGDVDCLDEDCVADPTCAGEDFDGDGVDNGSDCAPTDPDTWAPPGPIENLDIANDPMTGDTILTWDCLSAQAGPATVYDIVRGTYSQLLADGSTDGAECIQDDQADGSPDCRPSYRDSAPSLGPGDFYYYMVRGQNSCGTGSYGTDSAGNDRMVGANDCP